MREGYVNLTVANDDLFHKAFNDPALVLRRQLGPAVIERAGFMQDVVGGQFVDFEEIHLGLEFRKFRHKLVQPLLGRFVEITESLGRNVSLHIQAMGLLHFIPDLLQFPLVGVEQGLFLDKILVRRLQMMSDPLRLGEENLQLLVHDTFQVSDRDFITTLATEILWTASADIHFVAARTVRQPAEQMNWRFTGPFPRFKLFLNDLINLIPKLFGNDRFALHLAPFALRLRFGSP